MQRFEYKTITTDFTDRKTTNTDFIGELNELGDNGWEMVNAVSNFGLGSLKYSLVGITSYVLFVFKRKII